MIPLSKCPLRSNLDHFKAIAKKQLISLRFVFAPTIGNSSLISD
jgi:hypothetical protein